MSDEYTYDVDDPEVRLAERLEDLRMSLSLDMIKLREQRGLTKEDMAVCLDMSEEEVRSLEDPDCDHPIEDVVRYLDVLDADLNVVIRTDDGDKMEAHETHRPLRRITP